MHVEAILSAEGSIICELPQRKQAGSGKEGRNNAALSMTRQDVIL